MSDPLALCRDLYRFLEVDASFEPAVDTRHNVSGNPRFNACRFVFAQNAAHRTGLHANRSALMDENRWCRFRDGLKARLSARKRHEARDPALPARILQEEIEQLQALIDRDVSRWPALEAKGGWSMRHIVRRGGTACRPFTTAAAMLGNRRGSEQNKCVERLHGSRSWPEAHPQTGLAGSAVPGAATAFIKFPGTLCTIFLKNLKIYSFSGFTTSAAIINHMEESHNKLESQYKEILSMRDFYSHIMSSMNESIMSGLTNMEK